MLSRAFFDFDLCHVNYAALRAVVLCLLITTACASALECGPQTRSIEQVAAGMLESADLIAAGRLVSGTGQDRPMMELTDIWRGESERYVPARLGVSVDNARLAVFSRRDGDKFVPLWRDCLTVTPGAVLDQVTAALGEATPPPAYRWNFPLTLAVIISVVFCAFALWFMAMAFTGRGP